MTTMRSCRLPSGKTLAFLLPTIELLAARADTLERGVHAVVLSPTRELVAQIQSHCSALIKHQRALTSRAVLGGSVVKMDVQLLRKQPPSVLIATPGRLNDLLSNHVSSLLALEPFESTLSNLCLPGA